MITKEQAVNLDNKEFHYSFIPDAPCKRFRRNGMTKTWKTRASDFIVPVKFGLYDYSRIISTQAIINADLFHLASDCPNIK